MPLLLTSLHAIGFQCFPPEGIEIQFSSLSCCIGPNGAGKTAALTAIRRMFGVEAVERRLRPGDFYLHDGESISDASERQLLLEATFEITQSDDDNADAASAAVFDHMVVEAPGGRLFLRAQLLGTWRDDGSVEGDIEQQLYWIVTASADPGEVESARRKMSGADRSLIRAVYISATRDPSTEVRAIAGTAMGRLLRCAQWSAALRDLLRTQSDGLEGQLQDEGSLQGLRKAVDTRWPELYAGSRHSRATLAPTGAELQDLVSGLRPRFSAGGSDDHIGVETLSDGFKSLYSLAFSAALLDVEEGIRQGTVNGFDQEAIKLPILTVLLVEEPENHVSPHHLGRVVQQLREMSVSKYAQVALTSHSPSVVRRVEPAEIRFFLGSEHDERIEVRSLTLPDDATDAGKYIREAVRAHPELYFSRLVVLGEGASETVIIPQLFNVSGNDLDTEQISVVPLGGRHVNHMWRLLNDLGVPYVTLLDLDLSRDGGGWGRVKYVVEQLLAIGVDRAALLEVSDDEHGTWVLSDDEFKEVCSSGEYDLDEWIADLAQHRVYFSAPLDIDWLMLREFTDEYHAASQSQPRVPDEESGRKGKYLARAARVVLGDGADFSPYSGELELFPWYRTLFVAGSKPGAHMDALSRISSEELAARCPQVLRDLVGRCKDLLATSTDATTSGDER